MTAADLHPDTGLPRPGTCCGVCPPIAGGGWDCTCPGLPGCPVSAPAAEWDDLARLAEAATPGEWEAVGYDDMPHDVVQIGYDDQGDPWATGLIADSVHRPDAEFIAAANPATILRLIADNRRLRDDLDAEVGGRKRADVWREKANDRRRERDQLAARLAAVEAERDALADEVTRVRAAVAQALRQHPDDLTALEVRAALAAPTDTTKEN